MIDLYPWHVSLWQMLSARLNTASFPHALLFTGLPGVGQMDFCRQLTATLLCNKRQANAKACGQCRSCMLLASGNHPDFRLVSPAEEGKAITVDQIREAVHYANLTPQYGAYKVILVSPADKMNSQAANCFLKTLEEPATQTLIILLCENPIRLLATIRSRCQSFLFKTPPESEALAWLKARTEAADDQLRSALKFASGAPLLALELLEKNRLALWQDSLTILQSLQNGADPVKTAAAWISDARERLWWLQSAVTELIRCKLLPGSGQGVKFQQQLHQIANPLDLKALYTFCDQLVEARSAIDKQANVQLLMEKIFIQWSELRRY